MNSELGAKHSALFVWAVWLCMSASTFVLVLAFGDNVPQLDDWEMVPVLTGHQPVTRTWLWEQHNEHRVPLPRLLLVAAFHLAGGDFRGGMALSAALLSALSAVLIRAARAARGRTAFSDAFFPLVLLHGGHAANLLWFWQVGFVTSTVLAGLVFAAVARSRAIPTGCQAVVAGGALLLLPLCGAHGLVFVPLMALWLGVGALAHLLGHEPEGRRSAWWFLAASAVALTLTGIYLVGYHAGAMPDRPAVVAVTRTALEFLSRAFGPSVALHWSWWAAGVVALTAVAVLAAGRAVLLVPTERARAAGLLAFLVSALALAAGVAWGRSGFGLGAGLWGRYVTLAAPLACGVYLTLMLYCGPATGRILQAGLFATSALMLWPNTLSAVNHVRAWHDGKIGGFVRDLQAGVPPFVLADRYSRYPLAIAMPQHAGQIPAWMDMLRAAGVGPFGDLRDDPAYRAVAVDERTAYRVGPGEYVLKGVRFVYALRVHYRFRAVGQLADARAGEIDVFWISTTIGISTPTKDPAPVGLGLTVPVPLEPGEKSLLIWINGPVAEFRLTPRARGCLGQITAVELLVPERDSAARVRPTRR